MALTNSDIVELTDWRRRMHAAPELSGEEAETARAVVRALGPSRPDRVLTGLGGHGVAAVYDGAEDGPTVMIRAELDALPIAELADRPHKSRAAGKGHMCGHDGHMAILMGLSRRLGRLRPQRGRVVLMFQPAEETGAGAAAVIGDPAFAQIAPDWAFALHNMPGLPLGMATVAEGPANCASRGARLVLTGKTAHASLPESGVSPAGALAQLIPDLTALGTGGPLRPGFRLVTITHARLGEPAFGVAPGAAELWLTLRTLLDGDMAALWDDTLRLARAVSARDGLSLEVGQHDVFRACTNDGDAVARLRAAFEAEGIPHAEPAEPMRASEDFGLFGHHARSAMFLFGAGEGAPQLHNPDYDFPDDLIAPAVRIFERVVRDLTGAAA